MLFIITHFGSGVPSASGFMESLHRDRNTRNASFCKMCENGSGTLVESPSSSSLIAGNVGVVAVGVVAAGVVGLVVMALAAGALSSTQ